MLKKDQITAIAKALKIKESDLENAIKDEKEVELTLPEVSVFTTDELATRDKNQKTQGYKEGKESGIEMLIKEQKEKLGLDFEGKDADKFVEALKSKTLADANLKPDKKVEELNKSLETLRENLKAAQAEKTEIETKLKTQSLNQTILSSFPSNRIGSLKDEESLMLLQREFTFVEEDGKLVAKKGNETVKDKTTQAPLEVKDVIHSYFQERKWITEEDSGKQGRGGSSEKKTTYLKLSELEKSFQDAGKSVNGEEFSQAVSEAVKANPTFDLNA
ncbi:MAG TPA: hypothetical protein VGF79_00865 [Bacteroidia bacterium]